MNVSSIFATIQKGLSIVSALTAAKQKIEPAVKVIYDLATKGRHGTVTDDDIIRVEAQLDALIDDFNRPLE